MTVADKFKAIVSGYTTADADEMLREMRDAGVMREEGGFLDQMDQLAAEIAKQAREASTDLDIRINAFKALTPYWVHKAKAAKPDDDSGDDNFGSFSERIHSQETGHG